MAMVVNIPKAIVSNEHSLSRPIYFESFDDGSGFVFNSQDPSGVKYLPQESFKIYSKLINSSGEIPMVSLDDNPDYTAFVKNGIAIPTQKMELKEKVKPKVLSVWFHISNACNLSCSYCYIPKLVRAVDLGEMGGHFMSSKTSETATKELFDFCVTNKFTHLQIKFAGGEPTLNSQRINEVCTLSEELAKQYGIKVGFRVLTNGVFVDESIFSIFKRFKFGVSISVDGDEVRHNEIRFTIPRSRKDDLNDKSSLKIGTWNIISDNIDKLLLQDTKPYILCTVTQKNYAYLSDLVKFCVSKKIGFRFSPVRDKSSALINGLEEKMLAELVTIYEWIGENMPCTMPIERFARFAEWNLSVKKQSVCGTCKSTMSIDQEGNVSSCQMRIDKPFGNINLNKLDEIFLKISQNQYNEFLTNPEKKSGDCSICYWKFTCAGGCPEHTRNSKGTTNSPSPWCNLYQHLLPYYIRAIAKQIKRGIDNVPAT